MLQMIFLPMRRTHDHCKKFSMSDELIIRPFAPQDRPAVVSIWKIVFAGDPPWNDPDLIIDTKLGVQPQLFFVAELLGELVGTVIAGFDGFRGWVHHVAVHPGRQKKGIASSMLKVAEQALREMGCTKLNLQVRSSNTAVLDFYRELGFVEEERVSFGKLLEPKTDS